MGQSNVKVDDHKIQYLGEGKSYYFGEISIY